MAHSIRILAFVPQKTDATSFYRAVGPLAHLEEHYLVNVTYNESKMITWADLERYDLFFIQRPASPEQVQLIESIKEMGKPVWIDYDDDLINIPEDNNACLIYRQPHVRTSIEQCIKEATIVTVSTQRLKELYGPWNRNVFVVRNALRDHYFRKPDEKRTLNKTIVWRGGPSHIEDLRQFTPQILRLAKNNPEWKFVFMGFFPYWIAQQIPEQFEIKMVPDVIKFLKLLYQQNASIAIVPLQDHIFNYAKSNIAMLENSLGGAACVVPHWEEWKVPGSSQYSDPDGFEKTVQFLIDHEDVRKQEAQTLQRAMKHYFNLDRQNQIRWKLIRQVVAQSRGIVVKDDPTPSESPLDPPQAASEEPTRSSG